MKRQLLFALVLVSVFTLSTADARAGDSWPTYGGLPWFAYGYSGSLYGLGRVPTPPYYALHPPVYYSLPQRRPYGHSPFACDCHHSHARSARIVLNRYVEPAAKTEPRAVPDAEVTARLIVNPFYTASAPPEEDLAARQE